MTKKKIQLKYYILGLIFLIIACAGPFEKEYPKFLTVDLNNNSGLTRTDELISIDISSIEENHTDFNPEAFIVLNGSKELASQANDLNKDGSYDKVFFLTDLNTNEQQSMMIHYNPEGKQERIYGKRTQAEISHKVGGKFVNRVYEGGTFKNVESLHVPPEHTDHSWYIRYEGPGWESDKVGYRFYLDWRNATDIFGKKTTDMVLQNVGQDGFDSYHEMSDWGMDILKVGNSLGIGTIAMWIADSAQRVEKTDSMACEIISNGVIQSAVKTNYYGWQINNNTYDLSSVLSINAGSRLTKCDLAINNNPENLCTGLVKLDSTEVITAPANDHEWSYFATYGKQSLNNDKLGMAILYKNSDLEKITEDKNSHVMVLKPTEGALTYYFTAAWELERNGITSKEDFINYLDETVKNLSNPVSVGIK